MTIVAQQLKLRQYVQTVEGCLEHRQFRATLERIDNILETSHVSRHLIAQYLVCAERDAILAAVKEHKIFTGFTTREQERLQEQAEMGARCSIARAIMDLSYRKFHIHLADSALLQWFCRISPASRMRVPSKSALERYDKYFPDDILRVVNGALLKSVEAIKTSRQLDLTAPLSMKDLWLDTTAVKTNIHYPVDWVLFRDAIRTLMQAVMIIRREGLVHRMPDPKKFIRAINKLCIQMSSARRKKRARSERKRVLRLMKKLIRRVESHARRHRNLLEMQWETTSLGKGETGAILARMDNVLGEVKRIVFQAHERIIGERRIPNEKKLMSLYEKDTRAIVRGKFGAEVEFGNTLLLVEQVDGLIVDWDFFKEQAPADSKLLMPSLARLRTQFGGKPDSVTGDRGFSSPENTLHLMENGIENDICPRSVKDLRNKLKSREFCFAQNRRAQTEGRIGIFKNRFLGRPLRSKGFVHRDIRIGLCVLTHNLWVLARLINEQVRSNKSAA